jgi:hypothetical protein
MPRNPSKHSARPSRPRNRCQHVTTAGRRCRMLRAPGHPGLCFFHAQQNEQFINADEVAAELVTGVSDFGAPVDINCALGKLFKLVAAQRVSLREARTLAYISQQILNIVGPTSSGNFPSTSSGGFAEDAENDAALNQLREIVQRYTTQQPSEVKQN